MINDDDDDDDNKKKKTHNILYIKYIKSTSGICQVYIKSTGEVSCRLYKKQCADCCVALYKNAVWRFFFVHVGKKTRTRKVAHALTYKIAIT